MSEVLFSVQHLLASELSCSLAGGLPHCWAPPCRRRAASGGPEGPAHLSGIPLGLKRWLALVEGAQDSCVGNSEMKTNTAITMALSLRDLNPGGHSLQPSFALAWVPGSQDSGECQTANSVEPKAAGHGDTEEKPGESRWAGWGQASEAASRGRIQRPPPETAWGGSAGGWWSPRGLSG